VYASWARAAGHLAERHRHHGRGRRSHWIAVAVLVVLQFTLLPMLAMIAADTTSKIGDIWRQEHNSSAINRTVVFKTTGAPTL
jgi:ABC-type sulfate transport system permease component